MPIQSSQLDTRSHICSRQKHLIKTSKRHESNEARSVPFRACCLHVRSWGLFARVAITYICLGVSSVITTELPDPRSYTLFLKRCIRLFVSDAAREGTQAG